MSYHVLKEKSKGWIIWEVSVCSKGEEMVTNEGLFLVKERAKKIQQFYFLLSEIGKNQRGI